MLSIAESISDLLFLNDVVVVPGLGTFVRKDGSASANVITHQFEQPKSEILFDANLREDNDTITNYMSSSNGISVDEARKLLLMFVSDSFSAMKSGKTVSLAGIGVLSFDASREIVFEPANTVNYHPDSFGLEDFSIEPVFLSKTKAEIKTEIEQQQKDKNTPMTVDEKALHHNNDLEPYNYDDDGSKRHRGWLWILLSLLLVGGTLFGLQYFQVIDLKFKKLIKDIVLWEKGEEENEWYNVPVENVDPVAVTPAQVDTFKVPEKDTVSVVAMDTMKPETAQLPFVEEGKKEKPNEEIHERLDGPRYLIVLGCFSKEENAQNLLKSMKEKGCSDAFVRRRGKVWDVYSGSYATMEEAKEAMRELRSVSDAKVWILQSKE